VLAFIERYLIPDVLDKINIQEKIGLHFTFAELGFGVFGFLLVIIMILRPEGLFPERRRKIELTEAGAADESMYEVRA
jgi:branched-chain amino acid transport system permease protein